MKTFVCLVLLLSVQCIAAEIDDNDGQKQEGITPVRQKRDVAGTRLRVVGILETPYTQLRHDEYMRRADGLAKYEGFIPDLLKMITDRTHVEFDYYLVPDGRYGAMTQDGIWTGMIGEVIKKTKDPSSSGGADLAAAALTINSHREDVVDFINPFQHLGLSIIYKRPRRSSYEAAITFEILSALSPGVWLVILASFFLVSLVLWLINKFNPYEWRARYERAQATQEQSEMFNIAGAMWFTLTTLQWQGYESSPRSFGSRILAAFWFMFVTITLATYTGSLINNLFWASTARDPPNPEPFKDLAGLVKRNDYQFGCISGGSTLKFLTNAKGGVYDDVRAKLLGPNAQLVRSTSEGIERVKRGNYAFITESSMARFTVNRNCDLAMTSKLFGRRAFGMALRNNTDEDVREALHGAILELMEEGDIEALEYKWFEAKSLCSRDDTPPQRSSSLYLRGPAVVNVRMFAGPVIILLVGMIVSFGVTTAEIIYFRLRGRYKPGNLPRGETLNSEPVIVQ